MTVASSFTCLIWQKRAAQARRQNDERLSATPRHTTHTGAFRTSADLGQSANVKIGTISHSTGKILSSAELTYPNVCICTRWKKCPESLSKITHWQGRIKGHLELAQIWGYQSNCRHVIADLGLS